MPTSMAAQAAHEALKSWTPGDFTRVPYTVYQDPAVYSLEQQRVYRGPCWSYLCLESEVAQPGAYCTTHVGETPVVVSRDTDGELYAFENRCSHRGALIALERGGRVDDFQCVYHAWRYDLQGNLKGVAFEHGIGGKGGMPPTFDKDEHSPLKLRLATFCGLVFGSFSDDVPPIDEYLGPEIAARIERVLGRPVEVIGRFTQVLPNNWKLYFENVKDSYHASLLHLFFTTFRLNRLSQRGGIVIDDSGAHHVSWSMVDHQPQAEASTQYREQGIRSESDLALADASLLDGFREFDDGVTLQILSVFPGFVLQQIQNCLAIRQVLPKRIDRTELNWTYIGYADDTPEQRRIRLKQSNLVGPAGFVSMEDGAVGGFVQRGIVGAGADAAIVEMGGAGVASDESRVTEASVRGFWKAWRSHVGL